MSSRWAEACAGLLLASLAAAWFSLSHAHGVELRDEGHLLRLSALTAQGAMPHRDFSDPYGAGVFAVTGAALALADGQILGVRRMLVAFKVVLVLCVFGSASGLAGRGWGALAALLAIAFWGRPVWSLNTPYASVLTLPLLMAAFWCSSVGIARASRSHLAAAGAWLGVAFFFKQSLAFYAAIGIGLAIWAGAMLAAPQRARSTRGMIAAWLLVAALALVPFARSIDRRDYLVHFLPLHVLVSAVAFAVQRRGSAVDFGALARRWLGPFIGAGLTAFALCAAPHVWSGATSQAVDDMLLLPLELVNYHQKLPLPSPASAALVLAGLAIVGAALAALRASSRSCVAALAAGAVCLGGAIAWAPEGGLGALLVRAPDDLSSLQHAGLLAIALGATLPWIAAPGERGERARRLVPLLLFASFLCFVVFPRSPVNAWTLMGPDALLMAALAAALWRELGSGLAGWRKPCAAAALSAIPLGLAYAPMAATWAQSDMRMGRTPIGFSAAAGLSLSPLERALGGFDEFEATIAWLEHAEPRTAPVLLLTNQELILFASGRAPALPEHETTFFLAGWDMLPPQRATRFDTAALLRELDGQQTVFVVERDDAQAAALRATFPALVAGVHARAIEVARIGSYTISRLSRTQP